MWLTPTKEDRNLPEILARSVVETIGIEWKD